MGVSRASGGLTVPFLFPAQHERYLPHNFFLLKGEPLGYTQEEKMLFNEFFM